MPASIERHSYLLDFTLSSLSRRKFRNVSLLLLFSILVFLLASVMLFAQALRRAATHALAGSPDLLVQRLVAGRHDLIPPNYLDQLGALRGVQRRQPRLWGYYFEPELQINCTFMSAPPELASSVGDHRVLAGANLARALRLAAGEPALFRSAKGEYLTYTVARILPDSADLVTADLILLSEADFRELFLYPEGHYTDIALSVANPQELRKLASKISNRLPDSRVLVRDDLLRTYESLFSWREGLVLLLLAVVILAFAIFALEKASGLSAAERREIGILKAIGWDTRDVLYMKFWEGLLLSLTSFLLGYCAAYLHVFHLGAPLFKPVLAGWSVLYPTLRLSPEIDGLQLATLFFLTVFPYALATIVPVWRAATTDPDAVLRGSL